MTVECDGSGNVSALEAWLSSNGGATASDDCSSVSWSNDFEGLSDLCGATGSATVVFTATDDCGNSSTTSATFTIEDTTAPVITAASDMTVECDGSGNVSALEGWLSSNGGATASDDCSSVSWSNDFEGLSDLCGATGSATVVFTATDDCGNSSTTSATFTIEDTTAPVITAASDMTVECDGAGNESALEAWISSNGGATASDDCSSISWSNDFEGLSDLCGATGSARVVFTATDDCGNSSSISATFTIEDTTAPVITAASGMTVECDGAGNVIALEAWLNSNGGATASDDCSSVSWSNDFEGLNGLCGATGSATVVFTATDECGNSSSTSATFTIKDTTAPVITAASDMTVECDGAGNVTALEEWLNSNGGATASDDCSSVSWTNDFEGLTELEGGTATATVVFTATDDCGNSSTTSAIFILEDTTAPEITCPADLTSVVVDNGKCYATGVSLGTPTVSDNCATSETLLVTNDAPDQFSVGSTTVTWTVTDLTGNTKTCYQTVIVTDNEAPVVNCPVPAESYDTDADQDYATLSFAASPTDNCGVANTTYSVDGTEISFPYQFPVGITTVEVTVTDIHENSSICSFDVNVGDEEDPEIECSQESISVNTDSGLCSAMVEIEAPTVSDNSGIASLVNDYNGTANASDTYNVGTTIVTWTVTDLSGNTNTCSQTIVVTDNEAPAIDCAEDVLVLFTSSANEVNNVSVPSPTSYSDNCGVASIENDFNGLEDASGDYPFGTTDVVWTVTDIHGNISTCTQHVVVKLDSDDDDVPDDIDIDDDNDGILDIVEDMYANADDDNFKNSLDIDSDNDGIPDNVEGQTEAAYHAPLGMDTDGDGWDDAYDPSNGGTPIALADTDADGHPDFLDTDSDGDGIVDLAEGVIGAGESLVIPTLSGLDADEDGLDDVFDESVKGATFMGVTAQGTNAALENTDNDAVPDYRDIDSDNDGILDNIEAQEDLDNYVVASEQDQDGDGLDDAYDTDYNAVVIELVDTDGDGTPDFRDEDTDNDWVPDYIEGNDADMNGKPDLIFSGTDVDGDGLDDVFDSLTTPSGPSISMVKSALIGYNPAASKILPPMQDTDKDHKPDFRDVDDDNDLVATNLEDNVIVDGDPTNDDCNYNGIPNYLDPQSCDLIPDAFSPNGDGYNDYLVVPAVYGNSNARVEIYTRWGAKIYEKDNYGNVQLLGNEAWWDGKPNINGDKNEIVPEGTYFMLLIMDDSSVYKGTVFINR